MENKMNPRTHMAMNNFETILSIKGNLCENNTFEIWHKLTNWLDLYSKQPKAKTTIHFQLNYINQKNIIELTHFLKEMYKVSTSSDLTIIWEYEDENDPLFTLGEDIQWFSELQQIKMLMHNQSYPIQLKYCA